ncbi:MAG: trypsin-like peptidase domain-containing protein [Clostridia bacterium]|nr:trypsin-like peptidase domain-containing protein [Clostridia bacterium]
MKKHLTVSATIALVLICILALVACGTTASTSSQTESAGEQTADGETVYITAYDIAVRNGFVGTEEEWLASLHGKDGADGQDGKAEFSISDVYDAAVEKGYTGTFFDFVKEYLSDNTSSGDSTYAVSKAILSALSVQAVFTTTQYDRWGRTSEGTSTAGGAAVIYKLDKNTGDAYVITNFHVVYDANCTTSNKFSNDVTLYLYGSEYGEYAIPATVVGGSAYYDIAVLQVTGSELLKNGDARAVDIEETEVSVGQTAIAIGYPAAEGISVTGGIVSVDSETISLNIEGSNVYQTREFRVDAAINSGNSGGGLFNSDGKLIGVVNARHNSSSTETIENIGYAIPISIVTGVADNVIANCNGEDKVGVYKCMLGITTTINDTGMVYDPETGLTKIKQTVYVAEVGEGVAQGVLQAGDVITSATIGGKTYSVTRSYHLMDAMLNARVGDTVTIRYIRDGESGQADFVMTEDSVTVFFTM